MFRLGRGIPKPYSDDLRERVIEAVEARGEERPRVPGEPATASKGGGLEVAA